MNIINFIIQIQACKPYPAMARADDIIFCRCNENNVITRSWLRSWIANN